MANAELPSSVVLSYARMRLPCHPRSQGGAALGTVGEKTNRSVMVGGGTGSKERWLRPGLTVTVAAENLGGTPASQFDRISLSTM